MILGETTVTFFVLFTFATVQRHVTLANLNSDGCDWTGSGLDYNDGFRGVQPVYLRCSQGKVEWKYPRGALRIVLRHGTSGKDFKGCLKVSKGFAGARVFLEGHRTLHVLYSPNDATRRHPQLPRCFLSRNGQVALYVEAENTQQDTHRKQKAEFSYDLQLTAQNSSRYDPQEDCRPCSKSQLLRQFCTADFLAKGSIAGIYQNEELERTELTIRAKKVLRQNAAIFHPREEVGFNGMYGTIHVPIACGVQQGGGEFMLMGRMTLGEPTLTCAPRLNEWKAIRAEAIAQGANQCELS
ncbi:hypothetical protein CHUAL_003137 [Chamberlinius hualienensis]